MKIKKNTHKSLLLLLILLKKINQKKKKRKSQFFYPIGSSCLTVFNRVVGHDFLFFIIFVLIFLLGGEGGIMNQQTFFISYKLVKRGWCLEDCGPPFQLVKPAPRSERNKKW